MVMIIKSSDFNLCLSTASWDAIDTCVDFVEFCCSVASLEVQTPDEKGVAAYLHRTYRDHRHQVELLHIDNAEKVAIIIAVGATL
jgi:hypothetical protein